mmetsp:Transcript_103167/g.186192  ORF Transcript_103167/g.186192 Transcript_103167/m.186192 type:complete len:334 (+) Transcript_103167:296-1297(+)
MHGTQNQVANADGGAGDEEEANCMNHLAEHRHGAESESIPQDQEEGLLGGGAEVRAHQRDLDVSILVQELDALFETPDDALQCFKDHHQYPVLLRLGLLLVVVHEPPDELDHCNDEGAECHGAQVISQDVPNCRLDGRPVPLLGVRGEEPHSHCACDDALSSCNEEGVVPQEHEEGARETGIEDVAWRRTLPAAVDARRGVEQHAAVVILVDTASRPLVRALARSILRAIGLRVRGIRCLWGVAIGDLRDEEGNRARPGQDPADADERLHNWHEDDPRGMSDEGCGHLVHCHGQADPVRKAADQDEVHTCQAPKHVANDLQSFSLLLVGHRVA